MGLHGVKHCSSPRQLRSLGQHLQQCTDMQQQNSAELSAVYGINLRSPLLDLQYFDMCSGALVTNIMHDLLEGVLQYETKLVLQYYAFDAKIISAGVICEIMESFEFGFMEMTNRPTPIDRKILRSKDNLLMSPITFICVVNSYHISSGCSSAVLNLSCTCMENRYYYTFSLSLNFVHGRIQYGDSIGQGLIINYPKDKVLNEKAQSV